MTYTLIVIYLLINFFIAGNVFNSGITEGSSKSDISVATIVCILFGLPILIFITVSDYINK